MSTAHAALCLLVLVGCGEAPEDSAMRMTMGGAGGSERPECSPCYETLVAETDLCGPALDRCLDDPSLPAEPIVECFQVDGRCYDQALRRSSSCNEGCGDVEQAQVELCVAQCFRVRADCAERTVRGVDACLSVCGGAACDQCTANGRASFEDCDAELTACSDRCVAAFRGG